jgi:uncharacterized protein YjbJ (UPF0337 family)
LKGILHLAEHYILRASESNFKVIPALNVPLICGYDDGGLARVARGMLHPSREVINVNWDQVEGKWKQVKGSFKERWGKFTDDDLDQLAGKRDQIVGKMQEKYGISKEQASKDLDAWRQNLKDEERVNTSRSGVSSR